MLFSVRPMISSARSSRSDRWFSLSIRPTLSAHTWLAAICDRMSPITSSGVRTFHRIISITDSLRTPPS